MVDRYNNGRMSRMNNTAGNMGRCACSENSECKKLLAELQTVDFSMIDTILYLDAYPECREALEYYHKLKCERAALVSTLADKCNMPITSFDNASSDDWAWINSPWPWETAAN